MRSILLPIFVVQALSFNVIADAQLIIAKHYFRKNEHIPAQLADVQPSYIWIKDIYSHQNAASNADVSNAYSVTPHSDPVNVMQQVDTTPIFWGESWQNPRFYSDKILGMLTFYQNFQGATYADTVTEYLPAPLSHTLDTPYIDTNSASSNPNDVLTEICNVVGYVANRTSYYFPVYSDLKRGSANYCSYHAAGTCFGVPLQFAFFFNLDDDPGCDPGSPYAPPIGSRNSQRPGAAGQVRSFYQQSQGLAALANVSAHELIETVTDPAYFSKDGNSDYWGGWYDADGEEISDKCAWSYGPSSLVGTADGTVLIGRYYWKLQGEWSNYAEINNLGYPTQNNQSLGCIAGS